MSHARETNPHYSLIHTYICSIYNSYCNTVILDVVYSDYGGGSATAQCDARKCTDPIRISL